MELQPLGDAPRLRRRERLVQRRLAMGVQIVQDHSNHRDIRIGLIHQPAHLVGKVLLGAPFRYLYVPPPCQGFAGQEQVAGAAGMGGRASASIWVDVSSKQTTGLSGL